MGQLDEKDQIMLVMKEVEGFSVEEIGEVLGLNVNTVKVRLFRARGRLVEMYRKRMQKRPAPRDGLRQGRSEQKCLTNRTRSIACRKLEARLEDYLGGAPDPELEQHLAQCEAAAMALEDSRLAGDSAARGLGAGRVSRRRRSWPE